MPEASEPARPEPTLRRRGAFHVGEFRAMASPCEVLIDTGDEVTARRAVQLAAAEAWRIETTYSRYRTDNLIHRINTGNGQAVEVDVETAHLLDFAHTCFELSAGLFDITSGVLRRAWRFDADAQPPDPGAIESLLPLVGWQKVRWERPWFALPAGMQIDFGGLGKEYAVDRAVQLIVAETDAPVLVNFGGDLQASEVPRSGQGWQVGIEHQRTSGEAVAVLGLARGAIATSGDRHRFIEYQGRRYSHVLHPQTGWPVAQSPQSVTVAGGQCIQAGVLATLAMLKGVRAEAFLDAAGVRYWCQR